jgi:aminoglycoside phosphotransferase (APT) family kinase protein
MAWDSVSTAVESATGSPVAGVSRLESVANAAFEVTLSDSRRVVVKVPSDPDERLTEPRLLEYVGETGTVPVPEVVTVREERDHPFFVMEYLRGRTVDSIAALSARETRRLAFEVGEFLGELHELEPPVDSFGRLRCDADGRLRSIEEYETWRPRFRDAMSVNLDALEHLRLGDLVPRIRDRLEESVDAIPDVDRPALCYFDCKSKNVVLSGDDSGRTIRSVVDWEWVGTAHWAFNLAFPERVFAVRRPSGELEGLRSNLYAGYATARGLDPLSLDDEWYRTYRLAAWVLWAASPYWLAARDDWPDETAATCRRRIEALLER